MGDSGEVPLPDLLQDGVRQGFIRQDREIAICNFTAGVDRIAAIVLGVREIWLVVDPLWVLGEGHLFPGVDVEGPLRESPERVRLECPMKGRPGSRVAA